MEQTGNRKEIIAAFLAAQKEIGPATKNAQNPFFKSQYADLEQIWNVCKEALHRNGLCVLQPIISAGGKIELWTVLAHTSGQTIEGTFPIVTERAIAVTDKSGDNTWSVVPLTAQEIGSSITYARRYALAAMLGIVTSDDDGEHSVGRQPERQPERAPAPQAAGFEVTVGAEVPGAFWKMGAGEKKAITAAHSVKAEKDESGKWIWRAA